MPGARDLQPTSLAEAVEMFKSEFLSRHPGSRFLIDGEGYEDEDLDLNIYLNGDQLSLEQEAVEISHLVQSSTGYIILPFVQSEDNALGR